jgi:uncharacterized ubiquitin-like protein YukD
MAQLKVKLVDQAGKVIEVAVPDDRKISDVTNKLCAALKLPYEPGRQQMVLTDKVSGRVLIEDRTLSEEKVQDGDVLRFHLEATAGKCS